eukprot:GFYU01015768.1.p1 GENE.GFYU01015768.1~~GFYU01015768.1.p1  ORF type:complete len:183 (+),score=66.80 GFYU01015768.1:37-585(+)
MSDEEANPRGIPAAPFIEDVEKFVNDEENADGALRKMNEMYSKYKYMEQRLLANKKTLKQKLPDIKKTLEAVNYLNSKKDDDSEIATRFELCDNVYVNAKIKDTQHVCLWLGANVMLEYTVEEAIELLNKNFNTATTSLDGVEEDLTYLKEQITTCEVNLARIFNYDVKTRREKGTPAPAKA